MYRKEKKNAVHNTTPPLGRCFHTPFKQCPHSPTSSRCCPHPSRSPPFQGWQWGRRGHGSDGPTGPGIGTMNNECVVPHTSHSHGGAHNSSTGGGIPWSGPRICYI